MIIISEFKKYIDQIKNDMDKATTRNEELKHSHRLNSVRKVIDIINNYPHEIKKGEDLEDIKGVGTKSIIRINEILSTGKLSEIKKRKNISKYADDLEKIIGIGRKKALELIRKHKITNVQQLDDSYKKGKIELNNKIIMGLKYKDVFDEKIPRNEIDEIDKYIHKQLPKIDKELFGIICGSYRRIKKTSSDIDLLITHPKVKNMKDLKNNNHLKNFIKILKEKKFLLDDLTDKDITTKYMGFCKLNKSSKVRRIDIVYIPYESYYTALLYFTGSGDFNKNMRRLAYDLGYKLNEYGLYLKKNNKLIKIKIKSERDIFYKLGMEYIDPNNRK